LLFAIITVQKTPIREETYLKNTMYRKIHRLNMQYIYMLLHKKLSCFYAVVISQKKLCAVCCLFCVVFMLHYGRNHQFLSKNYSTFFHSKQVLCYSRYHLKYFFWLEIAKTSIWINVLYRSRCIIVCKF